MRTLVVFLVTLGLFASACGSDSESGSAGDAAPVQSGDNSAFTLSADAFADGEEIPVQFTCDGVDVSPRLFWTGVGEGVTEYALIMDDPDANGFVHWVVYGLPVSARELGEGEQPGDWLEGTNDFGRIGYNGPCPPEGPHEYQITMYTLSENLDLAEGASAQQVRDAIDGLVVSTATYSGTYARP